MLPALAVLLAGVVGDAPCDLYATGRTPCVAAHSMTRALFAAYDGALFNVQRTSDSATMDITVVAAGGISNTAALDAFCDSSVCVVQKIYDQTAWGNHLGIEHGAANLHPPRNNQDIGVNFTDPRSKSSLAGHKVYGAFFMGGATESKSPDYVGQGYSNRTARGTARGDEPQSMYAVFNGRHHNAFCCFDYGNAENVSHGKAGQMDDGSMEAVYFGSGYGPNGPGSGRGPWIGADMENGIYEGASPHATSPSLNMSFVAGFVKGNSGNHYNLKVGDPQIPGHLKTTYDGPRPRGYEEMKKQGAIILGIGGDNSPWAAGIFYEGVMTQGYSSEATDSAVMANIAAAGYGN